MKKINKIISAFLCLCLLAGIFSLTACSSDKNANAEQGGVKPSIVCTVFPIYDWVREILGDDFDNYNISLLIDNGVDLHNYQPSAADIALLSACDLFIYIGGESDEWADSALASAANEGRVELNLINELGSLAKEEEHAEGMQEDEEEHSHDEAVYDEHIWLSLKNAQVLCKSILGTLTQAYPEKADLYAANADSYIERLSALDGEYKAAVDAASVRTLLFADRFPFRYLTDDYGLTYYAAFSGCSAETEASFETISFLAKKIDELGLSAVSVIEGSDGKIAQTVIASTASENQATVTFNSMQSVTQSDIENGASYYSIMRQNLDSLKQALGQEAE